MPRTVTLTGSSLTLDDVVAVAREWARVAIDDDAAMRADRSREAVEKLVRAGEPVYGVNTGFGKLANVRIPDHQLVELQRNLIRSHVAGVGDPLPADVVRATMLLRANVVLRETSGVRSTVARRLADLLNARIHPVVPEQGSVGASGDLAPLAHIAQVLMGEGEVEVAGSGKRERGTGGSPNHGREPGVQSGSGKRERVKVPESGEAETGRVAAADALREAGIGPLELQAKEGLALINGTQAQTALLALLVHDSRNLWRTAHGAAAMSLEALMGTPAPFDERIHEARPHEGQKRSAALMRDLLADSEIRESHRTGDPRVQDAYSLRCTPQIIGPVGDTIEFAAGVLSVELNASTDNPLVFGNEVLSGGNFHGQSVAMALDYLTIALTTLAGLAERRLDRLMNPQLSEGLPPFLAEPAGLRSGLMMIQVTAAALVAEARTLATPASVQSIPTEADQEDVVPMGMAAAHKARRVLANAQRVVACELIAGAQGLEHRKPLRPAREVEALRRRVREIVPIFDEDRPISEDIERLTEAIAKEAWV
ncbi:MAG: histidine ammonia-lyase [Gemmatimonadales bacterium]